MKVVVYSTPSCVQCNQTKRALEKKGIPFESVDLSKDEEAMDRVRGLGFTQAPVVSYGEEMWSGFRPDKIAAIAA